MSGDERIGWRVAGADDVIEEFAANTNLGPISVTKEDVAKAFGQESLVPGSTLPALHAALDRLGYPPRTVEVTDEGFVITPLEGWQPEELP
jgi:hypothetical protein